MLYGLWDVVPHERLIVWQIAMLAVIGLRGSVYVAYRRRADDEPGRRWRLWFMAGSGLSGMLWGSAGIALFPAEALEYQLFILFILVGMGAGAISSLTAYMPAFYAYLPASLLPASARLFAVNDPIHIALAVMTVVYVAALVFFGRTINNALTQSLALRFANIDLVEQLSGQRDEAERANVGKSRFLAAASHDLRQPLHALALFASALDERIGHGEERRIVSNINASVRALEKLFNALLDISRLDAGVLLPDVRPFALDGLLSRLVNEHRGSADEKGLELVYEPTKLIVRSDPALLERIVRNYLSNAIRYTEQGKVRVEVIDLRGNARIDVIDTGIGIPASQHRAIFAEFHQIGNPERDRAKGLGLGLAIVDRVAQLLDHEIDVASSPGHGSRFSVSVPTSPVESDLPDASVAAHAHVGLLSLHVLVVDDEPSIREGMSALLRQWGCRVVTAGSEDEALTAAARGGPPPDVVIADYRLRDERTGVQLIARLRSALGTDIPGLIVTGDTAPELLREARAGGYPLLHKPIQPAALRAFLRRVGGDRTASESPLTAGS